MKVKRPLIALGIVILLVVVIGGFFGASTFLNTGDKALKRISPAEEPYLAKYNLLQIGMTYDQVIAIMGKPDREALGLRPTWRVNDSPFNQISAYFENEKLFKVRWMHIGSFILEK